MLSIEKLYSKEVYAFLVNNVVDFRARKIKVARKFDKNRINQIHFHPIAYKLLH